MPSQHKLSVSSAGVEPAISTLRAWRPLRRPTRTAVAQEGVEPSASLVLSESGLPVAYRAIAVRQVVKERECPAGIEPACPGWKPGASAARPRAHVSQRKERESNPQRPKPRPFSRRGTAPVAALPKWPRQESNLHPAD